MATDVEKLEKLQKQLNNKRNQINAMKKKIEKDRVHKMCEVAGFLFTEVAGWKGKQYNDYKNLDLENWQAFCLKNKEALSKVLKGEKDYKTPQNQGSNSPNNAVSAQSRVNTQPVQNTPSQTPNIQTPYQGNL